LRWSVRGCREYATSVFFELVSREELAHVRQISLKLPTESSWHASWSPETPIFEVRDEHGEVAVFELAGGLAYASLGHGTGQAIVAAKTSGEAEDLARTVTSLVGAVTELDDHVSVTFWAAGGAGPRSMVRQIVAPPWSEVRGNYPADTAREFDRLLVSQVPASGRLILWHGAPGTGKTTALRALARAWGDWCSVQFVTDPEAFLGSNSSYMLDVLTSVSRNGRAAWRLVAVEDAGDMLSYGNERLGQGLGRLLNLTDGLIGQGLKVIVLVTTNEPPAELHPAVVRPGRCWQQIGFEPLSVTEANEWLADRESDVRVSEELPLADLFGILEGKQAVPKRHRTIGFTAPD
jgi:hypothetical protein